MANLKDLIPDGVLKYDGYESTQVSDSKSTLTVIGWNGLKGNYSKHIVTCSVCSTDTELHGEGYFAISKGHLNRGIKPCGCSVKCNWTEEQYKIRLRRACELLGVTFKGWKEGFSTANATKVILECPEHGNYKGGVIRTVLRNDIKYSGCPDCFAVRMGNYKRKDDQDMIDAFMSSGGFAEGTQFRRSDRLDKHGHKKYWFVYCPECNTEGEAHVVGFYKGSRCCACVIGRPQQTYINLIKDNENVIAIKFGVANIAAERIKAQRTRSVFDIESYGVWSYDSVTECRSAERECMKTLQTGIVSKTDMQDGFSETTYVSNLDRVISIFEGNGGTRLN